MDAGELEAVARLIGGRVVYGDLYTSERRRIDGWQLAGAVLERLAELAETPIDKPTLDSYAPDRWQCAAFSESASAATATEAVIKCGASVQRQREATSVKYRCPYCHNDLPNERAACCGEVGHAERVP